MKEKSPDYTIKIWYGRNTLEWPFFAIVTDGQFTLEFSGKTEKALLLKIAQWMKEK